MSVFSLKQAPATVATSLALLLCPGCGNSSTERTANSAGGSVGAATAGAPGGVAGAPSAGAGAPSSSVGGNDVNAGGGTSNSAGSGAVSGFSGAAGSSGAAGLSGTSGAGGASGARGGFTDPGTEGDGKLTIDKPFKDDPAQTVAADVPRGQRVDFSMQSSDSKIYPLDGVGKPFARAGAVYLPAHFVSGSELPFMVAQDGVGNIRYVDIVPPALDNLINQKKVPAMAVIFIDPGPDAPDHARSERSLEYDTVSGLYTTFVESEVIPAAKKAVKDKTGLDLTLTADARGRGTLGGSSGAACAFTMGWFHPELYQKILSYSGSFQNLHDTPEYPRGAAEYINSQDHLVASADAKPLRVALQIGTADSASALGANDAMFAALTQKGYHTRYIVANGGGHVDQAVQRQTLAGYLVWLWRGYPIE